MKTTVRLICALLALCAIFTLCACAAKKSESDDGNGDKNGAPEGWKLADGESEDCLFYVPEAWTVDLKNNVITASSQSDRASVSLMTWTKADATPASIWESDKKGFEALYTDFKEENPENMKLDGADALSVVYTGSLGEGENASVFRWRQVIAVKGTLVCVLTYTNLADSFDDHAADFDSILGYFKFK